MERKTDRVERRKDRRELIRDIKDKTGK
jgi:hypothetical protein